MSEIRSFNQAPFKPGRLQGLGAVLEIVLPHKRELVEDGDLVGHEQRLPAGPFAGHLALRRGGLIEYGPNQN